MARICLVLLLCVNFSDTCTVGVNIILRCLTSLLNLFSLCLPACGVYGKNIRFKISIFTHPVTAFPSSFCPCLLFFFVLLLSSPCLWLDPDPVLTLRMINSLFAWLHLWLKSEKTDMHMYKNRMNKNNRLSPSLEAPISVFCSKLYHNDVVYYKKSSIFFFSGWATQTTQTNKWLSWQQMLQSRPQGFAIVMATTLTSIHKNQTSTVSVTVLPFCWNAAVQDGAFCSLSNKNCVCIADYLNWFSEGVTAWKCSLNVSVRN